MDLVLPDDFYKPGHQMVWSAVSELWAHGVPVDAVTVAGKLKDAGVLDDIGGESMLMDLQIDTPAISNAVAYANRVVRTSRLRSAISAASEVLDAVYDGKDPDTVLDLLTALGTDRRLLPRNVDLPEELSTMKGFLDWYAEQHPDEEGEWIAAGFLKRRHRMLFVGGEGGGKSTLLKQFGAFVSNGVHPFAMGLTIPQQRVLIVDAENPEDIIKEQVELIDRKAGLPLSESDDFMIWRCEQGLDLRTSRRDQAQFEKVIQHVRPALVIIGPVYKIYSNSGDSGMAAEQSAIDFFSFIDPLRKRYDFAIMLEHHAPKGTNDKRVLSPFGTVAWQRWPEFGVTLTPEDLDEHRHPHKLVVGRFRGDRRRDVTLPHHFLRDSSSSGMAWTPIMPTGHWNETPNSPPPPIPFDESEEPF